jgi:hypothetical protein
MSAHVYWPKQFTWKSTKSMMQESIVYILALYGNYNELEHFG